jgi:hypothetical protein
MKCQENCHFPTMRNHSHAFGELPFGALALEAAAIARGELNMFNSTPARNRALLRARAVVRRVHLIEIC